MSTIEGTNFSLCPRGTGASELLSVKSKKSHRDSARWNSPVLQKLKSCGQQALPGFSRLQPDLPGSPQPFLDPDSRGPSPPVPRATDRAWLAQNGWYHPPPPGWSYPTRRTFECIIIAAALRQFKARSWRSERSNFSVPRIAFITKPRGFRPTTCI